MDKGLSARDAGGLFSRLQQRYGLAADPVEMENPFYPGAMRQHALETLRHLCGFGDIALLLTAPEGMGKTRILAELVRAESARLDFHRIPASALTSVAALLRDLNALTRSAPAEGETAQDVVCRFFRWSETRTGKGQRLVLLIDDADQAEPGVLALLLSGFLGADRSRAAVPVFAGTDELVSRLEADADASSWHRIQLPPLQAEDVSAYLEPRIRQAGGPVDELLSARRLAQICALCDGSFSGIRRAAPAVWLELSRPGVSWPRINLNARAWLWPGIALILLAGSWWFVSAQYDRSLSARQEVAPAPPLRRSITIGPEAPALASEEALEQAGVVAQASDTPGPPEARTGLAAAQRQGETASVSDAAPHSPPALSPQPEIMPAAEPEAEPAPAIRPEPAPEPEPIPEPVVEPVPGAEAVAVNTEPEPEADTGQNTPVATAAAKAPDFVPARPARFVPLATLARETGWTVQLIAGRQEKTALNLLNRAPDDTALRYTVGERDGEPWFMVVYGQYPDPQAARVAARRLASVFGVSQPWIRSFASFGAH